ncbi:hypothetical protein GCM10010442_52990 [Kitasatospora kifunensis]
MAGVPVSVETTGSTGGCGASPATTARKSSSIGSISGEWNACETRNRLVLRPSAVKCSATAVVSALAPAITTACGALTAAIATRWRRPSSSGSTSASVAARAIISPPAGSACISRPRASTRVTASASEKTPATCAAAISPIECPARKSGLIPQDSTSRYSATSSAKSAGCA